MRLDKSGSYHTEEILYSQSLTAGTASEDLFKLISNFVEKMIWIGRNSLDCAQMAHLQ
ncbi:unnamed protein product [Acanthoscelides obtectus]|uniref:Uncharacterized protein n=1 Tax=Acanthoscelides obtectus TaxID=200917 RepID=A0A9P0P8Z0_ACAOB|nr:unnamed protein product [Acanthoscelides obtectus]CAK1646937.1 hypothetical protein AOBTE_LOCUS14957 [Acanthoscelides obtectus]